jgi:alkylation response protein AidB-like acyl-CoA dehydrogenase
MDLELSEEQRQIIETVRRWIKKEVIPEAPRYEHADEYPHPFIDRMKEMGLFGATIPQEYGGLGLDYVTYALINEELSRGWMSLSGAINTHLLMAYIVLRFGTEELRRRYLPRFATGEKRGGLALSEAHAGSDVAAIRTRARRDGDEYVVDGAKMWITNARFGNTFCLLAKTDPDAQRPHNGISAFVVEKGGAGFTVSRDIPKLGYKGIKTCELVFEGFRLPAANRIGEEGMGFRYVMEALELGRINIAARGCGLVRAAFEDSIRYAQQRHAFGKPIAEHQAIQFKLAEMATDLEAGRLLYVNAALKKQRGERADVESGMAKLFCSQAATKHCLEAIHIHGGYGYTTEFNVERYYRDAPLLTVGEGTNEILRQVISRGLVKRYPVE